jgi:hypothetical protein
MSNLYQNLKRKLNRMSEICADCRSPYQLTEVEKRSFEALVSQRPGFKMPRRCSRCRAIRRNQPKPAFVPSGPAAIPAIPMKGASTLDMGVRITSWERGSPKVSADPVLAPDLPKPERVDIVLGTGDFEALVGGKPVAWHGVQIVLADIGFKAMYDAIEHAEVARISAAHKRPAAPALERVNGTKS